MGFKNIMGEEIYPCRARYKDARGLSGKPGKRGKPFIMNYYND